MIRKWHLCGERGRVRFTSTEYTERLKTLCTLSGKECVSGPVHQAYGVQGYYTYSVPTLHDPTDRPFGPEVRKWKDWQGGARGDGTKGCEQFCCQKRFLEYHGAECQGPPHQ